MIGLGDMCAPVEHQSYYLSSLTLIDDEWMNIFMIAITTLIHFSVMTIASAYSDSSYTHILYGILLLIHVPASTVVLLSQRWDLWVITSHVLYKRN